MDQRIRGRIAALAIAAAVMVGGAVMGAPAYADDATDPSDPVQQHEVQIGSQLIDGSASSAPAEISAAAGGTFRVAGTGYVVICTPTLESPHISKGAGGVIYKTRVVCNGTGDYPSTVHIRVKSALMWDRAAYEGDTSDGINWEPISKADDNRWVPVDGSTATFYTPLEGVQGATATGHYQGSTTVQIDQPLVGNVTSNISNVRFLAP